MNRVYDSWYQTPEAAAAYRRSRRKRLLRLSRMRRRFAYSNAHSRRVGYRNVGTNTDSLPMIGPTYYKRTSTTNFRLHNAASSNRTYKFWDEITANPRSYPNPNPRRFVSSHDRMVRELPLPLELQDHISGFLAP